MLISTELNQHLFVYSIRQSRRAIFLPRIESMEKALSAEPDLLDSSDLLEAREVTEVTASREDGPAWFWSPRMNDCRRCRLASLFPSYCLLKICKFCFVCCQNFYNSPLMGLFTKELENRQKERENKAHREIENRTE